MSHTVSKAPIDTAYGEWCKQVQATEEPEYTYRDAFEAGYAAGIKYACEALSDDQRLEEKP